MSDELKNALTDVRKSYRLLWSYQRRIFDIVQLIADECGQSFYYWQVMHSGKPCNSGANPMKKRWAWDMLPMVQTSYLFLPAGVDNNSTQPGEWMLEILLTSDTGFEAPDDGSEPDPSDFVDAAKCDSTLSLLSWQSTGHTKLNWFSGVWNYFDYPENDDDPVEHVDPPFRVTRKTYKLDKLGSKDAVLAATAGFKQLLAESPETSVSRNGKKVAKTL